MRDLTHSRRSRHDRHRKDREVAREKLRRNRRPADPVELDDVERMECHFCKWDQYEPDPPTEFDVAPGLMVDVELAETTAEMRQDFEENLDGIVRGLDLPD